MLSRNCVVPLSRGLRRLCRQLAVLSRGRSERGRRRLRAGDADEEISSLEPEIRGVLAGSERLSAPFVPLSGAPCR